MRKCVTCRVLWYNTVRVQARVVVCGVYCLNAHVRRLSRQGTPVSPTAKTLEQQAQALWFFSEHFSALGDPRVSPLLLRGGPRTGADQQQQQQQVRNGATWGGRRATWDGMGRHAGAGG